MSVRSLAADLQAAGFRGRCELDVPLARFTTYRLGGPAALFVEPSDRDDVERLSSVLARSAEVPVLPLGRGSNLVVSDRGFPGVVVRLDASFSYVEPWAEGGPGGLRAGAAVTMPQVANWAARRGIAGFEWMISIPGSIGGGVRMNAGAHGGDVADVLREASIWRLGSADVEEVSEACLDYSYRHSNLSDGVLVLEARFAGTEAEPSVIRERMESFRKHRAETQPGALQNAGSVFKNPPGDSAGRLVEEAGLKGFKIGGAHVSELHANFFIAGDEARAQDVRALVATVRAKVLERFGVDLQPEIRFIGEFDAVGESD